MEFSLCNGIIDIYKEGVRTMSTLSKIKKGFDSANNQGIPKVKAKESRRHYQSFIDNKREPEYLKMQECIRVAKRKL